jgi:hypothetical protein
MKKVVKLRTVEMMRAFDAYKLYNLEDSVGNTYYGAVLPLTSECSVRALEAEMKIEIFENAKGNWQISVDNLEELNTESAEIITSVSESGLHPVEYFSAIYQGQCTLRQAEFSETKDKQKRKAILDSILSDSIFDTMEAYNKFNDILLSKA